MVPMKNLMKGKKSCKRFAQYDKTTTDSGWRSSPEIIPVEPDLGHTSVGKRIFTVLRRCGNRSRLPFGSGFFCSGSVAKKRAHAGGVECSEPRFAATPWERYFPTVTGGYSDPLYDVIRRSGNAGGDVENSATHFTANKYERNVPPAAGGYSDPSYDVHPRTGSAGGGKAARPGMTTCVKFLRRMNP